MTIELNKDLTVNFNSFLNEIYPTSEDFSQVKTDITPSETVTEKPVLTFLDEYIAEDTSSVDLSTIPVTEKISYGMEQETTLGYNAYQYISAALDAFLNDGDTSVNLQVAESLRQQEIDKKFGVSKFFLSTFGVTNIS